MEKTGPDSVLAQVRRIVSEELNVSEEKIQPGTSLESLGADSLEMVSIYQAVEKQVGPLPHDLRLDCIADIAQAITVQ